MACTLPNQLYFQYFILLLFSSPAGSLPFIYFFSLLFSHPHTSSHTPRFPLFSVLNFLSSLSFYVVFLFLLLFFLCVRLLQLTSASSHLTFLHFSLKFLTMAFLFCFFFFFFFCKPRLFISFISSSIFFFLVEILILQSKLHAGWILNFGQYLSRVSWLKEWGEAFLFKRKIQFQSPNDAV